MADVWNHGPDTVIQVMLRMKGIVISAGGTTDPVQENLHVRIAIETTSN